MKRVLIVDDNQLIAKLVGIYLDKLGWKVDNCDGPFGVMNKIKEFKPDVVLMDLNMPGLSGYKLLSLLKQKRKDFNCACRLISFSAEAEHVQKDLLENGLVDGYFVKSHTLEGLEEMMIGARG